jgi:hypothetical protein
MSANPWPSEASPAAAPGERRRFEPRVESGQAALDWPLPRGPWVRAIGPEPPPACQVQFDAHRFVNGWMLALDRWHCVVRCTPSSAERPIALPFDGLRCVRLMTLLPVQPRDSKAWQPVPAALPFRLEFHDGAIWTGWTHRTADEARGLFLFEPVDELGNLRLSFVPRPAWRELRIGGPPRRTRSAAAPATGDSGGPAAAQRAAALPRLGQVLLELGLVSEEQLARALKAQRDSRGMPLGELLVRQGALRREGLAMALAAKQVRGGGASGRASAPAAGAATPRPGLGSDPMTSNACDAVPHDAAAAST